YSTTIQEFKVETANFDAAVGHTTGATISVMTKAGTNEFHGALTEQHWQQRWNGTRFFVKQQYYRNISLAEAAGDTAKADQLRKSPLQPSGHSNNFAGTVGGPVILPKIYNGKNRLFFFFSFDGFEDRKSTESTFNHTVPNLAQRQGDFSDLLRVNTARYQLYDPLSVRPDPARAGHFLRDPIAGNRIPSSRIINPAYKTYTEFMPAPNSPPAAANLEPLNNYVGVAEPYNWSYKAVANRFDYQHSEKHRFFGRWSWLKYREDRQDWTYETTRGLQTNGVNRNNGGITADWVYTRGSSTVIDANAAANNFREGNILTPVALKYKPSDAGLPAYMDAKAGDNHAVPIMQFAGYDTLGQPVPAFTRYQLLSGKANALHIRGSHTVRTGIDVRNHRRLGGNPGITNGQFVFNNRFTSREDDGLTPAASLGHSWAAFMMGVPSSATVETNANYALGNSYFGWYVQDAWRISPKLTLNLGLRLEYELGRGERFDRVIGSFDPSAELPITAAAQAAYARSPIPELAASSFTVRGGSLYPGQNGAGRRLQAAESMWLPRIGAAYQIDSRTVVRAGYGIYYDTLNAQNQGPDQSGFSRATTNPITNDFGVTWLSGNPGRGISPLTDPFPERNGARFEVPVGPALGLLAKTGSGWTFQDYRVPRARQQRWRVDVQRQIGASMLVALGYAGSYSNDVRITKKLDALPGQYWATGTARNDALASNLNQNVANPYYLNNFSALQSSNPVLYQALTSRGFFTSPTIRKNQLLRPFSQMNGLSRSWTPEGEAKTHSFEATFQRRFAQGFTLNAGYTGLWERDRDFYYNEFDPLPAWRQTNAGVPHRISATGILELPFGRTKLLARAGVWNAVFGGWQVAAAYEWQPGPLLDWGNLFYSGNIGDINTGTRTLDRWFNTSGFERDARRVPAAFHARVFPQRIDGLRADGLDRLDANLQRDIKLKENLVLQLRLDALNVFNRSQFEAPNRDPVSTNFGRVTNNTSSTMRYLLFQARLKF
ncbi:MAG: TonB-dependent receptor, partial [Acidobacteria bacterium]|nr:TonB-dependent receptor [Acidobacteriota bacterium]